MLFFVRSVKFDISLFATISDISALFALVLLPLLLLPLLLLLLLLLFKTIMINCDYDDDDDYYYSLRGEVRSAEQSEFIISSRAKRPRSAWTAGGS